MNRIQIDEVEMAERAFLLELISTVLQLSYASLCEYQIWELINSECEGCKLQLPAQRDHICMMTENEEAFNLYYDDAMQLVDSNRVWELASELCEQYLDFKIHPSWQIYTPEFYKLPWTTVYLTILQFELCSDRTSSPRDQILEVLIKGPLRINRKKRTILKASKISCPEEFRRKDEERMDQN